VNRPAVDVSAPIPALRPQLDCMADVVAFIGETASQQLLDSVSQAVLAADPALPMRQQVDLTRKLVIELARRHRDAAWPVG